MAHRSPPGSRKEVLYSKYTIGGALLSAREAIRATGVEPDDSLLDAMTAYIELLLRWNQKINLTTITDVAEIIQRNFIESFLGAGFLEGASGSYCDVGSGAGFPGLALKLARPGWHGILLEPVHKKAAFLSEASRMLKFTDVEVKSTRWQDSRIGPSTLDAVTVRALGDYEALAEWAHLRLRLGGKLILWVGVEDATRLRSLSGWNWTTKQIPGSRERVLLVGGST